jgi:hypothetical protein
LIILAIAEIAGSGITRAAERDRADVPSLRESASARITAALRLKHPASIAAQRWHQQNALAAEI